MYSDYYSDDLPAPDDLSAPAVGDELDQLLSQLSQQDIDDLRYMMCSVTLTSDLDL